MSQIDMRVLSFGLIVAIIGTLIAAGSLVNVLYRQLNDNQQQTSEPLNFYRDAGQSLAALIDAKEQSLALIDPALQAELTTLAELPLPRELQQGFSNGQAVTLASENAVRIYYYLPRHQQVLGITVPVAPPSFPVQDIIFTLGFYCIVALALGLWLLPLIRSLVRLRNTSLAFGQGQLNRRIASQRFSYIGDIEKTFNNMADKIEQLLDDNKLLSRAVSHELKTPLARLRLGIDVLSENTTNKENGVYFERINRDLDEMQLLIHSLLQYSQLESNEIRIEPQRINLQRFCQEQLQAYEWYSIEFYCPEDIAGLEIYTDPQYFGLMFNNIVSNALHHGGTQVAVSIARDQSYIYIYIDDNGPGIPEGQRLNVFKLFNRGESEDGSRSHGIGLATVSRLAKWLTISVSISDAEKLGGARFTLAIPLNLFSTTQ